jgi:ribosomal protein S18 acetylase RimI-like enzyme
METFSISPAEKADCAECARLLVVQLAEHRVEAPLEKLIAVLLQVIADGRLGFVLVAREPARIIGVAYSATLLSAEHCGFASSLEELYVAPDCRQRGVGTALMKAVVERAKRDGLVAIELEVDASHSRVISLYQRFEFRRLDRSRWLRVF